MFLKNSEDEILRQSYVPPKEIYSLKISPTAFRTFMTLYWMAKGSSNVQVPHRTLAKYSGTSEETQRRAIRELEKAGVIRTSTELQKFKNVMVNRYDFCHPNAFKKSEAEL